MYFGGQDAIFVDETANIPEVLFFKILKAIS